MNIFGKSGEIIIGLVVGVVGMVAYLTKPHDVSLKSKIWKEQIERSKDKININIKAVASSIDNITFDINDFMILKTAEIKIPNRSTEYYLGIFNRWLKDC